MKRLFCALLALVLLCGCSLTVSAPEDGVLAQFELYSVLVEDGTYYMEFHKELEDTHEALHKDPDLQGTVMVQFPQFSDPAAIREAVLTGNIAEQELAWLERQRDAHGRVVIWPLHQLYDLRLPSDLKSNPILWQGSTYRFDFYGENILGYAMLGTQDELERIYKDEFTLSSNQKILSTETVWERSATVTRYRNGTGTYRQVKYLVKSHGKTTLVSERYNGNSDVPVTIDLWIDQGDVFLYGYLYGFKTRPSTKWLSAFELIPVQ